MGIFQYTSILRFFKKYDLIGLEIINSEYNRARLMIISMVILLVFSILNYFFLTPAIIQYMGSVKNYWLITQWMIVMLLFESAVLWRIWWFRNKGLRLPLAFKVIYSIVEVSFPSALMFIMMDLNPGETYIDSPAFIFYFLIILLSALHLDFRLSVLVAIVAAAEYGALVHYTFRFPGISEKFINIPEVTYYVRCLMLLLGGAAAGFVAEEINKRIKSYFDIVRSKREVELTFGQQVSAEIAHTLKEQGDEARRLHATVLALDIRNFSGFAESHSPNEILEFQNKIFAPILNIIRDHHGIVNQILGDGIMATFGAPIAHTQHAQQAFDASQEILRTVRTLYTSGVIPETRIGIGLHSGELITGNIGNENRKQYSFSGAPVIIAFRVEQLNKIFGTEFLITENIKAQISDTCCALQYLGTKPLKGLREEVKIYKVS